MRAKSTNSLPDMKTASRAWVPVVVGYSTAAVALVAFLTINGASGIPNVATIGTASLLIIGLLLPAIGMLQLRRGLSPNERAARYGFALQAFGLLGLLVGALLVVVTSSLLGYLIGAVFIVTAAVSATAGAVLPRKQFVSSIASKTIVVACMTIGTVLIFSGAGLIVGSNIAFEYLISQLQNTVYVDIGATISACGCVLAAYSFFILRNLKNKH